MNGEEKLEGPGMQNGIRDRGLREQLRSKVEFTKIFRKTTGLEMAKRIARSAVGLRKIKDWTLWRSRPPPKRRKNLLAMLA
jgi:hypothetical protein